MMPRTWSRLLGISLVIAGVILASLPVGMRQANAAPQTDATPTPAASPTTDLAAIPPTPDELAAIGLTGLGVEHAESGIGFAEGVLRTGTIEYSTRENLRAAGLIGQHAVRYSPLDEAIPPSRQLFVGVARYADLAGAETGFAQIAEPNFREGLTKGSIVETVEIASAIGDEDRLNLYRIPAGATVIGSVSAPVEMLVLVIRVETFVVRLGLTREVEQAGDADLLTALGELTLERIAAVEAGEIGGLGTVSLSLPTFREEVNESLGRNGYLRLAGTDLPLTSVLPAALSERDGFAPAATDLYRQVRLLQVDPGTPDGQEPQPVGTTVENSLLQFADDDEARQWLNEAEAWLSGQPDIAEVETVAGAAVSGDDSITLTWTLTLAAGDEVAYRTTFARIGERGFAVSYGAPDPDWLSTETALTAAQAECLVANSCADTVHLPPSARNPASICNQAAFAAGEVSGDRETVTAIGGDADVPGDSRDSSVQPGPSPRTAPALRWCFAGNGGFAHIQPPVVDGIVYAPNDDGYLYAIDIETGALRWRFRPSPVAAGFYAGAVVVDGTVVVQGGLGDEFFFGLDAETGEEQWRRQITFSDAYLAEHLVSLVGDPIAADGEIYIEVGDRIEVLDPADGTTVRTIEAGVALAELTIENGVIFSRLIQGEDPDWSVIAFDADSGDELWRTAISSSTGERDSAQTPLIPVGNQLVFATSATLYILDSERGEVTRTIPLATRGDFPSAMAVDGDLAILQFYHQTVAFDLSAKSDDALWRTPVEAEPADITVADGVVYVSTKANQSLLALDTETGETLWEVPTDGEAIRSPSVANGVVIGGNRALLYAFGPAGAEDDSTPVPTKSTPEPTPEPRAEDRRYQNETYEYGITWDTTWTRRGDDDDVLRLSNGTSDVTIQPHPNGNAQGCVQDVAGAVTIIYGDLELALDTDDQPFEAGDPTYAYALYFASTAEENDLLIYLECTSLGPDTAILVRADVPAEAFNDEIDALSALLENLTVVGA